MSKAVQIKMVVGDTELVFEPNTTAFNKFINEMTMENKIAPANNYLRRIISAESKESLDKLLDVPGAALQLVEAVNSQYAPKLEIDLKN
jgi:hypothetical protein